MSTVKMWLMDGSDICRRDRRHGQLDIEKLRYEHSSDGPIDKPTAGSSGAAE